MSILEFIIRTPALVEEISVASSILVQSDMVNCVKLPYICICIVEEGIAYGCKGNQEKIL
jgi:hypothetical protein